MDKDLLYRFFEGHASLEDMKVVKEWADASEENAGLLRRERKLFNAMILAGHSRRTDIQRMRNRRNYFIREFLKIASVIVITVSVTAVLFSIGKDNTRTEAVLSHVSCSTMPYWRRRLSRVTERISLPSTEMEPSFTS